MRVRHPSLRTGLVLAAISSLVLALLALVGPAGAVATGRVRGEISSASAGLSQVRVTWFTEDWHYLGARNVGDGLYSLSLAPGRYRLQFTDRRPAYNVAKYAPRDLLVAVRAGSTVVRNVRMTKGASIVGRAFAHTKRAAGARLVAANTAGNSFETTANARGEFALGGLPSGSYSVFTYDRGHAWVGRSTWVPDLKQGRQVSKTIRLTVRAGRLLVDLYGGGSPVRTATTVTVVSAATGQFWTARSRQGSVTIPGLYPGRYRIEAGAAGIWLPAEGSVVGSPVRAGHAAFGSFTYSRRGPVVTGAVIDRQDERNYPLARARVRMYDANGSLLAETRTAAQGSFRFAGAWPSQVGVTLVIDPDPDSGGWMQARAYCPYLSTTVSGLSLTPGRTLATGPHVLRHKSGSGVPAQCLPGETKP